MQGTAVVTLTFWCLNISDECSNCRVFPSLSPSLSLSCAHTHTHSHLYTIRIGRTIPLLHPHSYAHRRCICVPVTRSFLPPLWGELTSPASCREHQPIYRSRVSRVERENRESKRWGEMREGWENAAIMKQVLHRALVRDGECDGERQSFIIYLHRTGHSLLSSQILTCFELH